MSRGIMFALSLLGGLVTAGVGSMKLTNNHKQSDMVDEKFHDLAKQQTAVYKNALAITHDKKVLALNTLNFNYNSAGFSTAGGTGAQESSSIETSFNNITKELDYRYQTGLANSERERQAAQQQLHMQRVNDMAQMFSGILSYAKQAADYIPKDHPDVTNGADTKGSDTNSKLDTSAIDTAISSLDNANYNPSQRSYDDFADQKPDRFQKIISSI